MSVGIEGDNNHFALTAIITVFYQLFFFVVAASYKFDKVTDLAGGTNFVIINLVTWSLSAMPDPSYEQQAMTWLVVLWGLRLSAYLFYRIMKIGDDNRFDGLRDRPCQFLGFWIFQMAWVWVVSLPVTFVNSTNNENMPRGVSAGDVIGTIMAIVGLVIESFADMQKFNFKQDAANRSTWCVDGLWQYSRHPNYFGELLFWWGIFVLASDAIAHAPWAYFTILSPLFITSILFGLSGLPLLEASANERYNTQADYHRYRRETSILIPLPNGVYGSLPHSVKMLLLFEWPLFERNLSNLNTSFLDHHNITVSSTATATATSTGGNNGAGNGGGGGGGVRNHPHNQA